MSTGLPSGTEFEPPKQNDRFELKTRSGRFLPHWTLNDSAYAVTFRLADSLPKSVRDDWIVERKDLATFAEKQKRPTSHYERDRLAFLSSPRVEAALDAGYGERWLQDERIAGLVVSALRRFDGERYSLLAWCVMPTHVHAVVRPSAGYDLPSIVHSWKSFTASRANRILRHTGVFWQREYYDHLIRYEQDLNHAVEYVLGNPVKAGLRNWKWVGMGTD